MPATVEHEKPHVLIIEKVGTDTPAFQLFSEKFEYSYYKPSTRESFAKDMATTYSHVQAMWCSWTGLDDIGLIDAEMIEHLPRSLKVIASCAVGYDRFDAACLAKRNIVLCNSPGLAADPVADHVLFQTLSLFRYYTVFENITRQHQRTDIGRGASTTGSWNGEIGRPCLNTQNAPPALGHIVGGRYVKQPRGHVVGIVGFGAIGKEIGKRLSAIGMNVHYTKTKPLTDAETSQLNYPVTFHRTLESMLPHSDLLVLACPLNPKTHYMINKNTLALLPKEAKIVNIGRGALIDTRALLDALKSGHLSGAALDVFEKEPVADHELCDRWDVILTPHIGSSTVETAIGAEAICVNNIINVLLGDGQKATRVN